MSQKRRDRMIQAADESVLADVSSALEQRSKERNDHMLQNSIERDRLLARRLEAEISGSLPSRTDFHNAMAYLEDGQHVVKLICWGMQRTSHIWRASAFIVSDPAKQTCSDIVLWAAVLRGGYVMSPIVLDGGSGVAIKYKAAISTRRRLYVSANFRLKHRRVYDVIAMCVGNLDFNTWQLFLDAEAYKASANKRDMYALITKADKTNGEAIDAHALVHDRTY